MFDFLNSFIELLYLELRTGSTPYFPEKVDMYVCKQLVPGVNFALNLTQIPKRNPLTKYLRATAAADVPNKKDTYAHGSEKVMFSVIKSHRKTEALLMGL